MSADFFHSHIVNDLSAFRQQPDVIVANRVTDKIRDVAEKVFSHDLFGGNFKKVGDGGTAIQSALLPTQ